MKQIHLTLLIGSTLAGLTIMACGSSGGGNTPGSSSFLGTYQIETWVENKSGCDPETGESVLESKSDTMMVIESCSMNFMGQVESWLHAFKCKDDADCEENKCGPNELTFSGISFEGGNDSDGWFSNAAGGGGSLDSETCTAFVWTTVLTSGDSGRLIVTKATKKIENMTKDSEGWCDLDKAKEMAPNAPCTEIQVITLVKPGAGSSTTGSDSGDDGGGTTDGGGDDGTTDDTDGGTTDARADG